jgi:hypothetical protein
VTEAIAILIILAVTLAAAGITRRLERRIAQLERQLAAERARCDRLLRAVDVELGGRDWFDDPLPLRASCRQVDIDPTTVEGVQK